MRILSLGRIFCILARRTLTNQALNLTSLKLKIKMLVIKMNQIEARFKETSNIRIIEFKKWNLLLKKIKIPLENNLSQKLSKNQHKVGLIAQII